MRAVIRILFLLLAIFFCVSASEVRSEEEIDPMSQLPDPGVEAPEADNEETEEEETEPDPLGLEELVKNGVLPEGLDIEKLAAALAEGDDPKRLSQAAQDFAGDDEEKRRAVGLVFYLGLLRSETDPERQRDYAEVVDEYLDQSQREYLARNLPAFNEYYQSLPEPVPEPPVEIVPPDDDEVPPPDPVVVLPPDVVKRKAQEVARDLSGAKLREMMRDEKISLSQKLEIRREAGKVVLEPVPVGVAKLLEVKEEGKPLQVDVWTNKGGVGQNVAVNINESETYRAHYLNQKEEGYAIGEEKNLAALDSLGFVAYGKDGTPFLVNLDIKNDPNRIHFKSADGREKIWDGFKWLPETPAPAMPQQGFVEWKLAQFGPSRSPVGPQPLGTGPERVLASDEPPSVGVSIEDGMVCYNGLNCFSIGGPKYKSVLGGQRAFRRGP